MVRCFYIYFYSDFLVFVPLSGCKDVYILVAVSFQILPKILLFLYLRCALSIEETMKNVERKTLRIKNN